MSTTIAGAAIAPPASNMYVNNTGAHVLSMWDTVTGLKDANTFPDIFKQYGEGLLLRDVLRAKGYDRTLPSQDLNVIEEVADERPIILGAQSATSIANAVFYIKLSSANYEGTKHNVQANNKILIPATFIGGGDGYSKEAFVVSLATATNAYDTLTMRFMDSDLYIATAIPNGTYLALSGNAFARGTAQPKGINNYPVSKTYTWGICKASIGLEEDVLAQRNAPTEYNGNRWIINDLTMKLERRLEKYEDYMLHHGNKNDNQTNLVSASGITGDSGIIRSCDGLTTLLGAYGMCATYDTTFDTSHLDLVTDGFIAQGIYTSDVAVYCGHTFRKGISDLIRDYGEHYTTTDMYDAVKNILGISPDGLNYNSVNFNFQVLSTMSNPSSVGLTVGGTEMYEYPGSAIFIPDSPISVTKFGQEVNASIPNVGMAYVSYNGENSGKVFGVLKGMTNLEPGNLGTDNAGVYYYWKEEIMLFGGAWNQKFYFTKQ
jgi:hypothetical protein